MDRALSDLEHQRYFLQCFLLIMIEYQDRGESSLAACWGKYWSAGDVDRQSKSMLGSGTSAMLDMDSCFSSLSSGHRRAR